VREIYKKTLLAVAAFALVALGPSVASAFHGGGVAHCDGCHTMHNSPENPAEGASQNNLLLKGDDPSSTCLNCHDGNGSYDVKSTAGTDVSQGGDFYWMTKDYSYPTHGTHTDTSSKDNHGHNLVALNFGLNADTGDNATAPGGTYASADMGCNACHDPHGQVNGGTANDMGAISASGSYGYDDPNDGSILGNYRLLGGDGYEVKDMNKAVVYTFTANAPIARAEGSRGNYVDYGSGMSEWCANCHTDYINDSHKHPSGNGEHLNGLGDNYNSYVKTGDFTGDFDTAYDSLVPFERGVTTGGWDLDQTSTEGTDANSNVMCLTCHRAHASAHNNAGRWDFETELLADSAAILSADVDASTQAVYFKGGSIIDVATVYGDYQRSLCNKCHVQD
jgi:hypothetical protein